MTIGIIGAMEQEVRYLISQLSTATTHHIAQFTFTSGVLNHLPVVIVQSGIGKVAATIATTLMIQKFSPKAIINTGSAGGLDAQQSVGDVVISSAVSHHDVDVTAFGYELGQVPQMPAQFIADSSLQQLAVEVLQTQPQLTGQTGLIVTGDSFINDPERVQQIQQHFNGVKAVEMEGAAIAQTCYQLQTPWVIIRALSDIAGKESPISFDKFLETAAQHSAHLVLAMLAQWVDQEK